jgi:hypothetical protein
MSAARAILESRLAKLLGTGVDDNLDELLDTFIDMESVGDVIEYLSNFVVADASDGDGCQELNEFAADVVKYRLGEYDVSDDASNFDDDDRKPAASSTTNTSNEQPKVKPKLRDEAAVQREMIKRREMEARERQRIKNKEDEEQRRWNEAIATATRNEKQSTGNNRRQKQQQQQQGGQNNQLQPIQPSPSVAKSESNVTTPGTISSTLNVITQPSSIPPIVIKHDPRAGTKGKPMKESCGCYGTKCNAITNCLNCGRISCETEGINDYCHFCNIWIGELQFTTSSNNNVTTTIDDPAIRHKERLLEYDRTSASRTLIHDDQEDYYSAANSMWSTEQEREDNRLKEESRQLKLHERKKPVLNVKF